MKKFSLCMGYLCGLILGFSHCVYSERYYPEYTPSHHPKFQLIESDSSHAVIRYNHTEQSFITEKDYIYVGIPTGADYTYTLRSWDYEVTDRTETLEHHTGSIQSSSEEITAAQSDLESHILTKKLAVQELDVIRFQVLPSKDVSVKDATRTAEKKRTLLSMLEFAVEWDGGNAKKANEVSSLDAGFSRMYRSLVINSDQAQTFRRKRTLPETEAEKGFHPQVSGFKEEDKIINYAQGPVIHRKDAAIVRVRREGITAIRAQDLVEQKINPSSLDMNQARIWDRGKEKPLFVKDNGDGVFGNGDALYFMGKESDSDFSKDRIYYLTWFPLDTPPPFESKKNQWSGR